MRYLTTGSIIALVMTVMTVIGQAFADDTPAFKITTKRSEDRIVVKLSDTNVQFVVQSPAGIGSGTIERTTERWPDTVVLRLRLNGLESFKLSSDKLQLDASISSQNGDVRLWKDGKEDEPLDAKNPYWMEIRIQDAEGKPTKVFPLKGGFIEMQLPKSLLERNPKTLTLHWIDFYRN
jgi:hypothetical protein